MRVSLFTSAVMVFAVAGLAHTSHAIRLGEDDGQQTIDGTDEVNAALRMVNEKKKAESVIDGLRKGVRSLQKTKVKATEESAEIIAAVRGGLEVEGTGGQYTEKKLAVPGNIAAAKQEENQERDFKFAKGVTGESMAATLKNFLDAAYEKSEKMTENSKKVEEIKKKVKQSNKSDTEEEELQEEKVKRDMIKKVTATEAIKRAAAKKKAESAKTDSAKPKPQTASQTEAQPTLTDEAPITASTPASAPPIVQIQGNAKKVPSPTPTPALAAAPIQVSEEQKAIANMEKQVAKLTAASMNVKSAAELLNQQTAKLQGQ